MFVCIYTCMPVCMCGCAYCFTYLRHSYLYRQGRWLGRQKQQLYKHEFLSSEPQHPHKVKVCLEPSALSHLQRSGWGLRSSLASTSTSTSLSHRNKVEDKRKAATILLWPLWTCHTHIHIHYRHTKSVSEVPYYIYVIFQLVFLVYFIHY